MKRKFMEKLDNDDFMLGFNVGSTLVMIMGLAWLLLNTYC